MVVGGLGASQFVQDLIQEWSKDKNIKVASVDNVGCVGPGICPCRILTDY